jgi:hypothetical protein
MMIMSTSEDKRLMEGLIKRALEEGIVTQEQVDLSMNNPGTFIGADGFVGRSCKYCCGPDKPRGNIAIPLEEMHSEDVCKVCALFDE